MANSQTPLKHPRKADYASYIERIRGLVNASEFEMHVTYLRSINSEAFNNFKKLLLATTFINHKQTRKRFMEYVEALRSEEIDYDEFEVHVSRLREYTGITIDKEEQYRYSILFDETKMFFWEITPSYYETRAISENESVKNLYKILSGIDYETATLGDVLRSLGLLELVGNYNIELVCVIKKMLCQYHPDRNQHEKATEIFTLIEENVHKPISIILEDFEKYTDCSYTSCQLDEFLTWRIAKIKEVRDEEEKNLHHSLENRGKKALAIYNHLLSKVEPEGDFGYSILDERFQWQRPPNTFRMKYYRSEKADVLQEKDKVLNAFRTLIGDYISLANKKILDRQKVEHMEDRDENGQKRNRRILIEETEDLYRMIKNNKKEIKERKKCLEEKKKKMKSLLNAFTALYDPMIDRYEMEIIYLKDVCAGKIDFVKKWEVRNERNQEEMDRCRRKIKEAKLNTFVDERRLRLYQERLLELINEKKVMENLLAYLSKETAKPEGFIELAKHYCVVRKDKLKSKMGDVGAKFYVALEDNPYLQMDVASEFMNACYMYEHLKSECKSAKQQEDIENLYEKYEDFKDRFKTEEEKSEKSQKDKLEKKELLVLLKERKVAEAEFKEARRDKEEAKAKVEILKSLLLKLQSGDLSLTELQNMDITSLDTELSWRR